MKLTVAEIKFIRSLSRKKEREDSGLFVVEGEKMVREAKDSGFEIKSVYRRDEIGDEQMSRISLLDSPSPVLAVVRQKNINECPIEKGGLYVALDSVRDPGNMGTIIRLCDWFGVKAVLSSRDSVELYNPKVVQASMGSVFRMPVVYCDLVSALSECPVQVYGTFLNGENLYSPGCIAENEGGVIVMGNEANGISPEVAALATRKVTIPSYFENGRGAESLNVAIATAVVVSEFKRKCSSVK